MKPHTLWSNGIIKKREEAWTVGVYNCSLINTSDISGALAHCQGCRGCLASSVVWLFNVPGGVPGDEQHSCAALIPPVSPKTSCHPHHDLLSHFNKWVAAWSGQCDGWVLGNRGCVSSVDNVFKQSRWARCLNRHITHWRGVICYCEHGLWGVGDELRQAFHILL